MSSLKTYIKGKPKKPMTAWAKELGVSRPFLMGLLDGTRKPSPDVALRIQANTNGAVRVTDWPNIRAVIEVVEKSQETG